MHIKSSIEEESYTTLQRQIREISTSFLILSGLVYSLSFYACQDPSISCLSDTQCNQEETCVSGQCVGAELDNKKDPYTYYKEEMHYRLAAECGICHAAQEESEMPPIPGGEPEDENIDPYKLPQYTVALGDSGWRIYMDDLNEDKLYASYLDTMQYINTVSPEESLLFAFGRGEVGISQKARHPKLYFTRAEKEERQTEALMSEEAEEPFYQTAPIGYERLMNWAKLQHTDRNILDYNLETYREGPQQIISNSCSCHNVEPILKGDNPIPRGGFGFLTEPEDRADLAPLTALINPEDPSQSSLIRFLVGEYDHPKLGDESRLIPLQEAVVPWIEGLFR